MDRKIYEKTRYQNIYRHKKNRNYLVMISKPVKTSIAEIDGAKIYKIDEALKIRDNPKIKMQKQFEVGSKESFDTLWMKYIDWCKNIDKQSYNTYHKKEKYYNKYFKNKFSKVSKIKKEQMASFIDCQNCSDKTKNEMLKIIKPFFNWCKENEIIIINPVVGIKYYKVPKPQMKFLTPNEIQQLLYAINYDIDNNVNREIAYRTKMFILTTFVLGDRVGESRVLKFNSVNAKTQTITISGSINYDPQCDSYLSVTKTKTSDREIAISQKYIEELDEYKWFLINECGYNINDDDLVFGNRFTGKPISDSTLRKGFKFYIKKAGVNSIRMYDLRHTYVATMMAEGKELYHISERLGHKDYSTTVNKYGHLSNQVRKEIAKTTDKYF